MRLERRVRCNWALVLLRHCCVTTSLLHVVMRTDPTVKPPSLGRWATRFMSPQTGSPKTVGLTRVSIGPGLTGWREPWRRRCALRVAREWPPDAAHEERERRPGQRCVRDARQTPSRVRACSADASHAFRVRALARVAPRLRVLSRSAQIDSHGDEVIWTACIAQNLPACRADSTSNLTQS